MPTLPARARRVSEGRLVSFYFQPPGTGAENVFADFRGSDKFLFVAHLNLVGGFEKLLQFKDVGRDNHIFFLFLVLKLNLVEM